MVTTMLDEQTDVSVKDEHRQEGEVDPSASPMASESVGNSQSTVSSEKQSGRPDAML